MVKYLICKMVFKAYGMLAARLKNTKKAREIDEYWAAHSDDYMRECSYHKQEQLKPLATVKKEINELFLSEKCGSTMQYVLELYMLLGLDRLGVNIGDYILTNEFNELQAKHQPPYAAILDNKVYTLVYLAARGISVSRILGQVDDLGVFRSMDGGVEQPFHEWLAGQAGPLFCKLPDGMQGTSCFILEKEGDHYLVNGKPSSREELDALSPQLQVETVIRQHEDMAAIHPQSVNTCRIVTVCRNGKASFFTGFVLVGMGGGCVSNVHSGGMFVAFDENGQLGSCGITSLTWGGKAYEKHPDTGVEFAKCRIPFFKDAVDLALRAHLTMPTIRSIGWDIAITPTGPVIIEGNRRWATAEHQMFDGGMRKKAYEWLS